MTPTHSPRPYDDDAQELLRTNIRPMLISPNLRAALEYDELNRNSNNAPGPSRRSLDASVPLVGLPPPPRPKSRTTSLRRIHSPPATDATDGQAPPSAPGSPSPLVSPASPPVAWNPYINPPPRLPHLMVDSPAALVFPAERRSSVNGCSPRSSLDSRVGDSPRSETRPSPLNSSPESAGPPDAKPVFQRHLRYLSSLSKVDKLLLIGKSLTSGKSEGKSRAEGRRASDASSLEPCEKLGTQRRKLVRSRCSSGESGSSVGSPVIYASATAWQDGGVLAPAETDREARRSLGSASGAGHASAFATTRTMLSHHRSPSASTQRSTASSESSHDPPSTPNDTARISISSTLYQDSHFSIPFDAPAPAPPLPMTSPASDRESFIDLASPRSPDFRAQEFNVNDPGAGRFSFRTDLANLADLTAKPSPPILATIAVKPPVPTSPKPVFSRRSHSVQPSRYRPRSPDTQDDSNSASLPSTTNLLDPKARADRVRQNRKLAKVFGQSPGAIEALTAAAQMNAVDVDVPASLLCVPGGSLTSSAGGKRKQQHQRGAVSMSVDTGGHREQLPRAIWPPPEGTTYLTLSARRHSSPLTPDATSFLDGTAFADLIAGPDSDDDDGSSSHSSHVIVIGPCANNTNNNARKPLRHKRSSSAITSPTSFIDLSEEDIPGDGVSSIINLETPTVARRAPFATSPSSASIYSFTSEELAEEERRRKREKLAKLHRFLGSRVPTDLVLGQLSIDTTLHLPPPASSTVSALERPKQMDLETRKAWVRRRRSSSAAELGGKWSDDIDRLKEELNDREKAQNVKRAVKMEKMFGVAPPQTLYHTRAAPSSAGVLSSAAGPSSPAKQHRSSSYSPSSPHGSPRNANQSAYTRNKVKKKSTRPGTADSAEPLMNDLGEDGQHKFGFSEVYEHYRHSLNSLNDIIDRDDKASLERLHDLIHGDGHEHHLQPFTRQEDPPADEPPTPKAERRRSLPSRTSMTSLSSEFSISTNIASPDPQETTFQARRRRAAKLTQFFGVDYRDLMSEVLDSLEKGLEEEGGRGTLKPDEVQELLSKLRNLKTKRNAFLG